MTRPRRPRTLRPDERRLWAQITRGIVPMSGRAPVDEPEPEPAPPSPATPAQPGAGSSFTIAAPPIAHRAPPLAPPLAPIERKTLLSLRRGTKAVDAVIDLHGMRQAEAHGALLGFLRRAQASGHSVVLVITGKGGAGSGDPIFEERGVLRRMVPHWLRLPDVRSLVLGFEESSPHHGGSGALYVRLRRARGAGPSRDDPFR